MFTSGAGGTRATPVKLPRPRVRINDPACLFAAAYGYRRGYTDRGAGDFGDRETRSHYRGFWTLGAGAGQYLGPINGAAVAGWGCDNGDGVTGNSSQEWIPDPPKWMDLPAQNFTLAVSIRPDVLSTSGTLPFFKRSAQPYGATNAGWRFTGAAGNLWRFNWSNGATQGTVTSTTAQDANLRRIDFLVIRGTPSGANLLVEFFINGVLEVSTASSTTLANAAATEATKILGLDPTNVAFSGFTDVAYVFKRPLTTPEIMRLSGDRFWYFRHTRKARRGLG